MKLARPTRLVAALIALISLLFMQLAVASYACPGMTTALSGHAMALAPDSGMHDMPGCAGSIDKQQPGLCHAHGHASQQSLDKPEPPPVQPFVAVALTQVLSSIDTTYHPTRPAQDALFLTRAMAPPLAIRHCCFRI